MNWRSRPTLVAVGFSALAAALVVIAITRSNAAASPACPDRDVSQGKPYEPIWIGPMVFDLGPDASSGTQFRWLGHTKDGYILKAFIFVRKGSGSITIRGINLATGGPLRFDYAASGYQESLELGPDTRGVTFPGGQQTASGMIGIPGALAAPDLGAYRVTVTRRDGREWSRTISICFPLSGPRS